MIKTVTCRDDNYQRKLTDYVIEIQDQNSEIVESANNGRLAQHVLEASAESCKTLEDLFGMARSKALGVDAALDTIMKGLAELDSKTYPPLTDDDVPF